MAERDEEAAITQLMNAQLELEYCLNRNGYGHVTASYHVATLNVTLLFIFVEKHSRR
jgi:hypothetical protein